RPSSRRCCARTDRRSRARPRRGASSSSIAGPRRLPASRPLLLGRQALDEHAIVDVGRKPAGEREDRIFVAAVGEFPTRREPDRQSLARREDLPPTERATVYLHAARLFPDRQRLLPG